MADTTYHTERLDHLGIIAGICDEMGLVEQIDRLVPAPRRLVSIGQAVKAMVINALGFVSRPLYLDFGQSAFCPHIWRLDGHSTPISWVDSPVCQNSNCI